MRYPCDVVEFEAPDAGVGCEAKSRNWILVATILASSMAFIDSTVVNVAIPSVQATFNATIVDVQWVIEAYGLFLGALILVGGSLGDLFGRRLVFLLGIGVFALSSVGCALAFNIQQLIIARSIQGIGAALLVPGSLAIISASFDEKTRGQAIGTWSGFTAITTALGPILGGWLVENASWRWAFLINIPIAAAVIIISLLHIRESRSNTATTIDWTGAFLISIGLGALVYGFTESANLGFRHPLISGSLILGLVSLIVFLFFELNVANPMVPPALFKSRSFSGANLLTLFLYSAVGIFFFLFPLNLIQVQGYSATAAGAAMLPMILLMFLFSRRAGGLVRRFGARAPLIAGPLIAMAGFLLFALPTAGGSYWTTFLPAMIVLGIGMTLTVAPLTTVVMSSVSEDFAGTASGINNAVARVAGVLAIAVLGIVMVSAFASQLGERMQELALDPMIRSDLQTNAIRLAGLQVPSNVAPKMRMAIRNSIASSFVFGFRLIMLVCGGLSAASAWIAWLLVPKEVVSLSPARSPWTRTADR